MDDAAQSVEEIAPQPAAAAPSVAPSIPITEPQLTPKEELALKRLVTSIDLAYNHPWKMLLRAFGQGMMSAIGAAFGTVLILAISGYVANQLGLFTGGLDRLQEVILSTQKKAIQEIEQPTPTPKSIPTSEL